MIGVAVAAAAAAVAAAAAAAAVVGAAARAVRGRSYSTIDRERCRPPCCPRRETRLH